jgi:hypothetical protein
VMGAGRQDHPPHHRCQEAATRGGRRPGTTPPSFSGRNRSARTYLTRFRGRQRKLAAHPPNQSDRGHPGPLTRRQLLPRGTPCTRSDRRDRRGSTAQPQSKLSWWSPQ